MIEIENKMPGFSEIVLVTKSELVALQDRVKGLLEANNKAIEDYRKLKNDSMALVLKKHVNHIIAMIQGADKVSESSGSCGDGLYDYKQRTLDHQNRMIAIEVLKEDVLRNL